jgi:hypothetical protein
VRIRLTLKPGKPGTKQLLHAFGDRLICVRYRYDPARGVRIKTAELVIEQVAWQPKASGQPVPRPSAPPGGSTRRVRPGQRTAVAVAVAYREVALRAAIKAAGGVWDPGRRAWLLSSQQVRALGLEKRIIRQ